MPKYLVPHTGGSWKVQVYIPEPLRPAFGNRVNRVGYIPAQSERDATVEAMKFVLGHKALFKELRKALAAGKPLPRIALAPSAPVFDWISTLPLATHAEVAHMMELAGHPVPPREGFAEAQLAGHADIVRMRDESRQALEAVAAAAPVDASYTWQALRDRWQSRTGAKYTAEHDRTVTLLETILGVVDVRRVTVHDIERFLKALPEHGVVSVPMQRKIRFHVSGMFRECIPHWRADNPCRGNKVEGDHKPDKTLPFSGKQIKAIRKAAVAINYHDALHDDAMWVLDIQTFMGCRVNEAAQLQAGDIDTTSFPGIPCVWFRQEDAGTGRKHDCKSIKTSKKGSDKRFMPLHPALWDKKHPRYVRRSIVDLAKGKKPDAFLFGFDRYQRDGKPKPKGGAQWMIQNGHTLLAAAGIAAPAGFAYKPNHSFRGRMNDAMKNAGGLWNSDDEREAFLGHATSVNSGYGGDLVRKRAKALKNVDPLADD